MNTMSITLSLASLMLTLAVTAVAHELPPEATRLIAQRDRAVRSIDIRLCDQLEKLKVQYTKRGDLDSAIAIAEIIKSYGAPSKETPKDVIEGTWKRKTDGTIWIFDGKGSGVFSGNTKFEITYNEETRIFTLKSAKWTDTVSYGSDMQTLEGMAGESKNRRYRLERIK